MKVNVIKRLHPIFNYEVGCIFVRKDEYKSEVIPTVKGSLTVTSNIKYFIMVDKSEYDIKFFGYDNINIAQQNISKAINSHNLYPNSGAVISLCNVYKYLKYYENKT